MGLFSLYTNKKAAGDAAGISGGGNPDDRPRPVVRPRDDEGSEKKRIWRDSEGHISTWEIPKVLSRLRGRHGFSQRKAAIVDAVTHNALDERGGQKGMNAGELNETMEALEQDAHKLGLTKDDLAAVRTELEEKL